MNKMLTLFYVGSFVFFAVFSISYFVYFLKSKVETRGNDRPEIKERSNQLKTSRMIWEPHNDFLKDDITLVTAYFYLPAFLKGCCVRKPEEYFEWMEAFSWVVNPLVIYLDNETIYSMFNDMLQRGVNNSFVKLILVKREQLWIFRQKSKIEDILKQPDYPIHYPSTFFSSYNCITHAKFELLKLTIEKNYFNTKYYMWIDIGYFRMKVKRPFGLSLPPNFNERKILLSQVGKFFSNLSSEAIVYYNLNWVAGGAILGQRNNLYKFCLNYLLFIQKSIKLKTIGAEQQMLYAMYSSGSKEQLKEIQFCTNGWFCLGHLCAATWLRRQKLLYKSIYNNVYAFHEQ